MRGNHKFTIAMAVALLCIAILFLLWAASPALAGGMTRQEALHEAAEILRAAGYKDDDAVIKTLSAQWWVEENKKPWREDVPLSAELQDALLAICEENGVDPLLALGLIETESGFQTDIVSPWGDYGLCQLNKAYFRTDMTPEENMAAGIGLLASNIKRYGTVEAALTAYNRGHDDGSRSYAAVVLRNARKWGYE